MSQNHIWGINWQMYHKDQYDMPHIERMGYRSFTIYEWMWSDRGFCSDLLSVARQDAIFLNRDHPLSEQKDDLWKNNPAQKGRNHADEWAQKVREGKVHTPLDRTYFLGLNEPDSNHYQRQIDAYNEAFCRRMAQHGLKAAAYSFGVGHPSTVNLQPKTPIDWSWYEASAAAILEGNHIAAFHEYGAPQDYGWEFWCNRVAACPYPFEAVLDECGIDHGVLKSGYLYGWAIALKPEEYVQWLDGFQLGMAQRAHTRKIKIRGYNIFSFDHGRGDTKDWHSFDIRPLRALLEAQQWTVAEPVKQPDTKPVEIKLPFVGGGVSQNQSDNWRRSREFVKRWEGGYSDNPEDHGNWTGGRKGQGELKGTKFGISAASYPHLDIRNLTIEQADEIYKRDYWQASGADKLPYPYCLLVFDTAVLHGVGTAKKWVGEVGDNAYAFAAKRLAVYTKLDNWQHFGAGWVNRVANLLEVAGAN